MAGQVKKRQRQEPECAFPKLRMPPLPKGPLLREAPHAPEGQIHASDFRVLSDNLRQWHHGLSQLPVGTQEEIGYTAEHMEYMCQWSDSVSQQLFNQDGAGGSIRHCDSLSDALCRFTAMMISYRLRDDDAMRDVVADVCSMVLPLALLHWVTSSTDAVIKKLL